MGLYINGSKVGVRVINRVVFREQFQGSPGGATVTYPLTGTGINATFRTGAWESESILNTLQAYVTGTNYKPVYDSIIPLLRNKIEVSSINTATGIVTLTYPPRAGVDFYIWYWYDLEDWEVLEDYYRPDFVTEMEGDVGAGAASLYDTDSSNVLNLAWNEDDTSDRKLSFMVNGGDRIIDLSANLVVEGTSYVNQDLTTDGSPQFVDITLTGDITVSSSHGMTAGSDGVDSILFLGAGSDAGGGYDGILLALQGSDETMYFMDTSGDIITFAPGSITSSTGNISFGNENLSTTGILTLTNTGLHLLDINDSHDLVIAPGSDLTADRTLTLTTGDSDRTLTIQGNPILDDWFDQAVKTTSTPTFAGLSITGSLGIGESSPHGQVHITHPIPQITLRESDRTADEKVWDFLAQNAQLRYRAVSDDYANANNWLTVDRTGYAVDYARILTKLAISDSTITPTELLHVYRGNSLASVALFQNSTTGANNTDGLYVGIDAAEVGYLWYYENANVIIGANNATVCTFGSDGNVHVANALDVADSITVGDTSPGTDYLIKAVDDTLEIGNSFYTIYNNITKTGGASTSSHDMYSAYNNFMLNQAGGDIRDLFGGFTRAQVNNGTVNQNVYGERGDADINAGTVSGSVYGISTFVDIEPEVTSIGGSVFGVYIWVDADKDPTGSVYMLYLDEQTGVDYGIYQDGSAPNYFGGAILGFNGAKLGDGGSTNYTEIEADGTAVAYGDAQTWNDINMWGALLPAIPAQAPDQDEFKDSTGTDTGIQTWAVAIGEGIHGAFELLHDYVEGTDIYPHVHWQGIAAPTGTDHVHWQLTYTVLKTDGTVLSATTTITVETDITTQYGGYRSDFAAITGINFDVGDQFLFILERIAATSEEYNGDALLATVGVHYQQNTLGSRTLDSK